MTILTIGSDAHRRMSYFADLIFVLVQKEIPVTPFQRPCMTAIRRDHVSKAYLGTGTSRGASRSGFPFA